MAFQKVLRIRTRYTDEFKIEAVRQVRDRDYSVINVADRLGITTHSLAAWSKKLGPGKVKAEKLDDGEQEARPLNAEFNRVIKERDIRKKAARHFDKELLLGHRFIKDHQRQFRIRAICRVLDVHPSGIHAWLKNPLSKRAREDQRQTGLIKQSWLESGGVHAHRKVEDGPQFTNITLQFF